MKTASLPRNRCLSAVAEPDGRVERPKHAVGVEVEVRHLGLLRKARQFQRPRLPKGVRDGDPGVSGAQQVNGAGERTVQARVVSTPAATGY